MRVLTVAFLALVLIVVMYFVPAIRAPDVTTTGDFTEAAILDMDSHMDAGVMPMSVYNCAVERSILKSTVATSTAASITDIMRASSMHSGQIHQKFRNGSNIGYLMRS